ncbi:sodium-dependent bicarbonate transport family permease [Microcella sp.]|uniref:sodium-dependent bicarbonate transport family permease n=1 Tax=Microcella sp. TaxID=1913979 RepID=UPI0039187A32
MSIELALQNLLSPPVLAFLIGIIAVVVKSDLRVPDALTQSVSIYLLLAIGLKGGVALRSADPGEVLGPILLALALGIVIPFAAYLALRVATPLGPLDRGSIAAHYGSTSLVTFTAALVFLDLAGLGYPGYAPTLLAVLEIPGIIIGVLLAMRHSAEASTGWRALRDVMAGKSIILLLGGLAVGAAIGERGYAPLQPFFVDPLTGVLTLFLLALGLEVGLRLGSLKQAGFGLIVFALVFPLLAGSLGVLAATAIGMSVGGAVVLGILCGSASYIAAPAAVRFALPDANLTYPLSASLGVTFPLNLLAGIPLLTLLATTIGA